MPQPGRMEWVQFTDQGSKLLKQQKERCQCEEWQEHRIWEHVTEFMGKLEVAAWKDQSGLGVQKDGTGTKN